MNQRELVGAALTLLALLLIGYELFVVGLLNGSVGTKGQVTLDAVLISAGFLLILLGPWLWLGEVPVAVKRFVEAKTGRRT
ncbi:MAG: hypothetical protein NZ902_01060 [Acidilobaceae archaeon]|nr:hypothetical protein [Acidilobaceae archaeon]MCX8165416.1 hypothetical protein [Acidilobaceae archaeon]MDW7973843.1 hypothetical protein [Sulfolobales archaeon]